MTKGGLEPISGPWLGRTRGASPSESPSWAPILLSGAIPRELSDLLAVAVLALVSLEGVLSGLLPNTITGFAVLILLTPMTTMLAALSDSAKREREELALFAYGGSAWQIQSRYFLRGSLIVLIGLLPLHVILLSGTGSTYAAVTIVVSFVLGGGAIYVIPALRRTRSLAFVEQYKG